MHELDDVKRALVRGAAKAAAERTGMPMQVIMSLASVNGWDIAKAEALVNEAMEGVAREMNDKLQAEFLYGGGPGGGKQDALSVRGQSFVARVEAITSGLVEPSRGGVVPTCVS